MRSLARNKKSFYYALYTGKSEVTDGYGRKTGQYTMTYSTPVLFKANIAPATGVSDLEMFGQNTNYSHVISTSDMTCPIDETSHLWIGVPTTDPYNFVVVRKAESLNCISYAIREVNVSVLTSV